MAGVWTLVVHGGPMLGLLILLSLFSIALIVAKVLQLRSALSGDGRRAQALDRWGTGDREGALRTLDGGASPADRLLARAMEDVASGRPRAAIDADLEWRGNAEMAILGRHIRLLELIAMVAPLMGLLGTVLGMIRSFRDLALAQGAANASLLAAGIWEALATTAAGLIVAIPAAIAASLLSARVDAAAQRVESAVGRLYAIEDRLP